ncbi:hypothetical protein [uncultured Gimesia sp.]|uniref:hypothetical protein n=1 Tax=uncultured Gimesia sp. TaxID=1678688 RepID=UPI0030D96016
MKKPLFGLYLQVFVCAYGVFLYKTPLGGCMFIPWSMRGTDGSSAMGPGFYQIDSFVIATHRTL